METANKKGRSARLKKMLKIGVVILAVGFGVIQLFRPNRINPAINSGDTIASSTTIPDDVKSILERSCSDCHSNATNYPWYSNISPFSWFLDGHIRDGRAELNFSVWNTYQPSQRDRKIEEICEQVQSREMPLPSYLWFHRDAAVTDGDIAILCDWANSHQNIGYSREHTKVK